MPGLSLGTGAQVNARGNLSYSDSPVPAATTATQAAFGTEMAPASSTSVLAPSHPAGVVFWAGVAGVAFMLFLYYSLPS